MDVLSLFRQKKQGAEQNSAAIAKERLTVLIAHNTFGADTSDIFAKLQKEILEVVRQYFDVSEDQINLKSDREENCEVLVLNIPLPERRSPDVGRGSPVRHAPQKPYTDKPKTKPF